MVDREHAVLLSGGPTATCGESVNAFLQRAISEAMERDNAATGAFEGRAEAKGILKIM